MKKIAILVSLMVGAVAVMAQTAGQFIVPVKTAGGRTETGVTLSNGEVLGKSGGVPAAISLSSYLTSASALNATNLTSGTLPADRVGAGSITLSKLAASGATTGQVVTWNGSAWAPATPSGGGGGSGLDNVASTISGGTLTLAGTLTAGRTLTVRDLAGTIALTSDLSAYLTTSSASSTYEPILTAGTTGQYYRGDKSWQTLNASAVGLGNVSNALQLVAANNLSDLTNTSTARSNLGLGTLATQNGTISDYLTTATAASTYEPIITAGTTGQYYRGDKSWQTLNATAVGLGNVSNALQLVAANNLSDLTNTSTARSNLGLGTLATQNGTISDYLTTAAAASTYASLTGTYSNPSWITGLAWSKITGTPTTIFGYGITDALSTVGGGTVVGAITVETSTFPLTQVKLDPAFPMLAFYHNGGVKGTEIIADSTGTGVNQITLPNFDPNDFTKFFALTTNADGSIANSSVTNAMLAGSIAASKLVGSDITTVGTITSGTWNGNTIAIDHGGTGQTSRTNAYDALSPNTTKGDITVYNGTDNVRLAVGGTNGHVLTVDSSTATGVKWAAASGGGSGGNWVLISTTTISGSPSTLTFTFSGSYRKYRLELENVYCTSDGFMLRMRTSTDGGSTFDSGTGNYGYAYGAHGTYGPTSTTGTYIETSTNLVGSATDEGLWGEIDFFDPLNASLKTFARWSIFARIHNSAAANVITGAGYRDSAADVDTVQLFFSSGNFGGGKIRLFGWSE